MKADQSAWLAELKRLAYGAQDWGVMFGKGRCTAEEKNEWLTGLIAHAQELVDAIEDASARPTLALSDERIADICRAHIHRDRSGEVRGAWTDSIALVRACLAEAALAPEQPDTDHVARAVPSDGDKLAPVEHSWFSQASLDVTAERRRQVAAEGWTPEHDDEHKEGVLALAAVCYAEHAADRSWFATRLSDAFARYQRDEPPKNWPWGDEWWKPKNPRRDLVRAAALILAEIERLDRAACIQAASDQKPNEKTPASESAQPIEQSDRELMIWHAEADRLKKCVDYATSAGEEYVFRKQLSAHLRQRLQEKAE